jgi:hypothetical protein
MVRPTLSHGGLRVTKPGFTAAVASPMVIGVVIVRLGTSWSHFMTRSSWA